MDRLWKIPGLLSLRPKEASRPMSTIFLLALAGLHGAPAAVVNGTFNQSPDGLAGWNIAGQVFNTGQQAVLTDNQDGRSHLWQAVFGPGGPASFEFDVFTTLAGVVVPGGVPDTLFASLYFLADPAAFDPLVPASAAEFFAVADFDVSGTGAPTFVGPGVLIGPSAKGSAYRRVSLNFDHPGGFVAPVFEVSDLNGVTGDSIAAIDNVVMTFIPEPRTLMFIFPTLLALARRRRSSTGPGA